MSTSSVSSSTVVYFITGANRANGIGFGLTEELAKRPNTLVYATARDAAKADALQQLAKKHSNVRVVQLRVDSDADHQAAAKRVEAEAGRVDVVIANAGISNSDAYQPVEKLSIDKLREHFEVNAVGPARLFKALFPLLSRSSKPIYTVVSSFAGSVGYQTNLPKFYVANYGSSKAAANFLVQRIHVEHTNITAFPIHPGWVKTDMSVEHLTQHAAHCTCTCYMRDTHTTALFAFLPLSTCVQGQCRSEDSRHGGGAHVARAECVGHTEDRRSGHTRDAQRQVLEFGGRQGAAVVRGG